jgi:hypothetical protein
MYGLLPADLEQDMRFASAAMQRVIFGYCRDVIAQRKRGYEWMNGPARA